MADQAEGCATHAPRRAGSHHAALQLPLGGGTRPDCNPAAPAPGADDAVVHVEEQEERAAGARREGWSRPPPKGAGQGETGRDARTAGCSYERVAERVSSTPFPGAPPLASPRLPPLECAARAGMGRIRTVGSWAGGRAAVRVAGGTGATVQEHPWRRTAPPIPPLPACTGMHRRSCAAPRQAWWGPWPAAGITWGPACPLGGWPSSSRPGAASAYQSQRPGPAVEHARSRARRITHARREGGTHSPALADPPLPRTRPCPPALAQPPLPLRCRQRTPAAPLGCPSPATTAHLSLQSVWPLKCQRRQAAQEDAVLDLIAAGIPPLAGWRRRQAGQGSRGQR